MSQEDDLVSFSIYEDIDIVPKEIRDIHLIKLNQINMMRVQGFNIEEDDLRIERMNNQEFWDYWNSMPLNRLHGIISDAVKINNEAKDSMRTNFFMLSNMYAKLGSDEYSCIVLYLTREGKDHILLSIVKPLFEFAISNFVKIIFITTKPFTKDGRFLISSPPATKREGKKVYPNITVFKFSDLLVNPLKSQLVPLHSKLDKKEAIEFKRSYRNPLLISVEDPVVKYYGWEVGDVILIRRDISSVTATVKNMIAKRLVVYHNQVSGASKI